MSKGAKKGENRFKASQEASISYRIERIKTHVIPKIKSLSLHMKVNSSTAYCKLCAKLFNDGLSLNDKPIAYRVIKQNRDYWELLGPVYYQLFEINEDLDDFKKESILRIEIKELQEKLDNKEQEVNALSAMLKKVGNLHQNKPIQKEGEITDYTQNSDKLCRIILAIIESTDGVILIDRENSAIRNLADDFEGEEGLLPKEVTRPFIDWINNRDEKFSSNQ
ncbi:hypothetical protein ACSFVZ_00130 [Pseudoalteromonas sp. SYSU M81236]|uniref:hypothetical protein n=1 Tax=Pseudoalteromonas sp. SYSU M81236 TaxID=3447014 RepID=UPI003F0D10CF